MTPAEQQAVAYLSEDLPKDEGNVPYVYFDSLGFATIGIGFMVDRRKGGKLFPEEIAFILGNRIAKALAGVRDEPWFPAVRDDPVRLCAILNMQFQLGPESDEAFPNTFGAIARKDWRAAAAGMRASLWARQTPARAERAARMIETGRRA